MGDASRAVSPPLHPMKAWFYVVQCGITRSVVVSSKIIPVGGQVPMDLEGKNAFTVMSKHDAYYEAVAHMNLNITVPKGVPEKPIIARKFAAPKYVVMKPVQMKIITDEEVPQSCNPVLHKRTENVGLNDKVKECPQPSSKTIEKNQGQTCKDSEDGCYLNQKVKPRFITKEDVDRHGRFSFCLLCRKYVREMRPHLLSAHSKHEEVVKIQAVWSSKERVKQYAKLKFKGNAAHNALVNQRGYGLLLVSRASAECLAEKATYTSCPFCQKVLNKKCLNSHKKLCGEQSGSLISLKGQLSFSSKIVNEQISLLEDASSAKQALEDPALYQLAKDLFLKHRPRGTEVGGVVMREALLILCDLFEETRVRTPRLSTFSDLARLINFQQVTKSLKVCYGKLGPDASKLLPLLRSLVNVVWMQQTIKGSHQAAREAEAVERMLINLD